MVKKSIIWSEKANLELRDVLEFYTKRNGNANYSFKILERVEEILQVLETNEFLGRLTENKQTRVIVNDVYLIFYEIHHNQIEILSFWDNRQDPEKRMDIL